MNRPDDSISAISLADLAKAGYSVSRQSFMQVSFEVHHLADSGGYLRKLLHDQLGEARRQTAHGLGGADSPAADWPAEAPSGNRETYLPRETVSSAANGVGLVIATYAGFPHPEMRSRRQGSGLPVALKVDNLGDSRVFRGTAWPNPTFIYESARAFEGLISVDEQERLPSYLHGLAICELLHFVSELAKKIDAPLLLLHCPVQLPPARSLGSDIRMREESWPKSSAVAVRFSIALKQPSAELRLRLARAVSLFCKERGFGFWLADLRIGYRSGNWFPIQEHNPTIMQRRLEREFPGTPAACPTHCLPVTIVGPARVGSTHAVMSFLREHPRLGVLACSVSSLDDLAFIHLQLAINDESSSAQELEARLDEAIRSVASRDDDGSWTSPPQELLPVVLPLLTGSRGPEVRPEVRGLLTERAGSYQALAGPPMPLRDQPDDRGVPLWFSWQATGGDAALAAPLIAFVDAAKAVLLPSGGHYSIADDSADPTIQYLICRDLGDSVFRGKGKIFMPSPGIATRGSASLETAGARLSTSLEDAWRSELEQYSVPGIVELAVAWHEYRLDHSTTWL